MSPVGSTGRGKLTSLDLGQMAQVTALVATVPAGIAATGNARVAHMAFPTMDSECLIAALAVGSPARAEAYVRESGCRIGGSGAALQLPVHIIKSVPRELTFLCCRGDPIGQFRGMTAEPPASDVLAHVVWSVCSGKACEVEPGRWRQ